MPYRRISLSKFIQRSEPNGTRKAGAPCPASPEQPAITPDLPKGSDETGTEQPSKKQLRRNRARRGWWRCTHRRCCGPLAPPCPCSFPSPPSAAAGKSTGDTSTDPTAPMPASWWRAAKNSNVGISSHAAARTRPESTPGSSATNSALLQNPILEDLS